MQVFVRYTFQHMWLFRKKGALLRVLLTIDSAHVSGAYVRYEEGKAPTVHYAVSRPIQPREGEPAAAAVLRAVDQAGTELIEKGAPALRRETGSGRADDVLIAVAGPWQETHVRSEIIQPGAPFTFSRKVLGEVLAGNAGLPPDRISFGDTVIATILNGYPTTKPLGKTAKRAEVVILSSTLDRGLADQVRARVRALYHTHTISFTAFAPVAYRVLRDLYPHEKDFLMLTVAPEGTGITFVKNGLLVDVGTLPQGLSSLLTATRAAERLTVEEERTLASSLGDQPGYVNPDRNARFSVRAEAARDEWLKSLAELLKGFAERHALPRTLFVLTDPGARSYLSRVLDSSILHALWLSDEPLSVITLQPSQFSSRVLMRTDTGADIPLLMLARYGMRPAD